MWGRAGLGEESTEHPACRAASCTSCSPISRWSRVLWLHDGYLENEEYAGLIVRRGRRWWEAWTGRRGAVSQQIPPAPPRPDFRASWEKLQKLGEGDSTGTLEFARTKQELEAECLCLPALP